jgi:hypothetical protein
MVVKEGQAEKENKFKPGHKGVLKVKSTDIYLT